mgnify:CR=1 FL=1|tara:strand:- start:145 stop:921 length:777 start_codon:yes stop_codon:yes gene_type:complete
MINKKYIKLLRSQQRFRENNFIYKTIAKRIIDSLDLLNLDILQALEIGINENVVYDYLKQRYNNLYIHRADLYDSEKININRSKFIKIDIDNLELEKKYYNLIYSNCFIFLNNNFVNTLKRIFESLNSNGVFITALPDKNNMFQLVNSMYKADQHFYDGYFQRFNPTIEVNTIFDILKKLNYDSPSIHSDIININYDNFKVLLNDIRFMGLSYCYKDKKKSFENKSYFDFVEKFYKNEYFKEKYFLDIRINIITAWKK